MPLFAVTNDLSMEADVVRRRRYGVIETCAGRLDRIVWRPFPKIVTALGAKMLAPWLRRLRRGNRCRLYFNEPRSCPGFLALRYVESTCDADFATVRRALAVLDEVARLKNSDALLCDVTNLNISDRMLAWFGWVPHAPRPVHRNFSKRRK